MGPLGLVIPEQTRPHSPSIFDAPPKKVEAWIDGLPRAHVGETSRLVYGGLREMNALILTPEQRHAVLELLIEPTQYITQSLEKHFLGHSFPLTAKTAKIAALSREIKAELATGYKIVLENLLAQGHPTLDKRKLASACFRAIQFTNEGLLVCYQTYSPHPLNVWRDLHKLYQYAYTNDLHLVKHDDIAGQHGIANTVDGLYKHALLLDLVNPYQLSQEDVAKIEASLPYWSQFCSLTGGTYAENPPGMFAVDLSSDQAPSYYTLCKAQHGNCLYLDTTQLAERVRNLAASRGAGVEINVGVGPDVLKTLSVDTLKRIIVSWGLLSKRNFKRRGASTQVRITLGLSATHHYLAGASAASEQADATQSETDFVLERASFSSEPVIGADGSGRYPEILELDTNELTAEKQRGPSRPRRRKSPQSQRGQRDDAQTFNVTNESAGGYCLLWKHNESGALKIGDLLCLHHQAVNQAPQEYNICAVRWMKNIGDMMVLGVEVLTAFAHPVATKALDENGANTEYSAGLLIPSIAAVNRPATLLTSTLYRSGDILDLKMTDGDRRIKLTHIQQRTTTFKQFQFVDVDKEEKAEESAGFETIWSSLS